MTANAEEKPSRQLLPSAEEILALPADGGADFNRLIFTHSPYLLQHARNPVDWYPWGEEAFERARKEDKPVFLSIGYTTCHWCHVMEHESFEDAEVADFLNQHFIAVKVDREERPDIDEVYMTVTQALTGGGGWPMTVVMTPGKEPFFAGTYFPKDTKNGRPGVKFILQRLREAWLNDRQNVNGTAKEISEKIGDLMIAKPGEAPVPETLDLAFEEFQTRYDKERGGFGQTRKFPVPQNLMFLLRYHQRTGNKGALEMVENTLRRIRLGGIYDQVGHGIHRYSTDPEWLVPHFEKMLYDQALLVMACLEAHQLTGNLEYATTAREVLGYVSERLTSPQGGFYSAEDADSEGVEGKFYLWSNKEIKQWLGEEEAAFFIETFNFKEEGNFLEEARQVRTGENIPHLTKNLSSEEWNRFEALRKKIYEHREKRIHPQKDDKILTDWNGLMIAAFARAGQALNAPEYTAQARRAADFVLSRLLTPEGRLLKRYRVGQAGLTAHLEDYAFVIWGLLDLYEATFDLGYLQRAIALQGVLDEFFSDQESGGYFMTATDSEKLIARVKKLYGGAIPGGNEAAALNLAKLYKITGDEKYLKALENLERAFSNSVAAAPSEVPLFLSALDFKRGPGQEVVISGRKEDPGIEAMAAAIRQPFLPNKVLLFRDDASPADLGEIAPHTRDQASLEGRATVYVCRDFTCQLPTDDLAEVMKNLLGEKSAQ